MKNYLKTFLISIIIHLILLLILFCLNLKSIQKTDHIKFNIISERPMQTPQQSSPVLNSEPVDKKNNITKKTESSYINKNIEYLFDYENIKNKIDKAAVDTAHYKSMSSNDLYSNQKISLNKYIKDKLKEDYPNQFKSDSKKPQMRIIDLYSDFICDKIEAKAFSYLFNKNQGTQLDIYSNYDFTDSITASQLNARLEKLVNMGFLSHKKISPQLPFTISAVFIQIPIEMSQKNRENPVYEYKPLVNKKNLITYLQAKLFRLKEKLKNSETKTSQLKKDINSLQESLQILTSG